MIEWIISSNKSLDRFRSPYFQAAYLIGTADPASEPGRPGLVDQSQFARSQQAIQLACQSLVNPANDQQQVVIDILIID